jgi:hypothetical protein
MRNLLNMFVCFLIGHRITENWFRHPKSHYKSAPYICLRCFGRFEDGKGFERRKK